MFKIVSKEAFHDGVKISTSRRSIETHLNDNGVITSSLASRESNNVSCFAISLRLIRYILITVAFIALAFHKPYDVFILMFCILNIALPVAFIGPTVCRLLFKKRSSTARYHAALHQVQNAYHELERIPTLEEARSFSMICPDCILFEHFGTITEWLVLTVSSLIVFVNDRLWGIILFLAIYFIWVFLFNKMYKKYKGMQVLNYLALSNPTDKELLVVIECLTLAQDELNAFVHCDYAIKQMDPSALSGN